MSEDWGVIAAAIAAISSFLAASFSAWQIHTNLKQSALSWLYEYLSERNARESALLAAVNDDDKYQSFIALLNFLEATALAYNQDILPNRLRQKVFNDLCKTIATIKTSDYGTDFVKFLQSEFGLDNTKQFLQCHSRVINRVTARINSEP